MRSYWIGLCLLSLSIVPISGCGPSQTLSYAEQKWALQELDRGMSSEQIRAILGTPSRTVHSEGELTWMVYQAESQRVFIYFQNNEVVAVPNNAWRTGSPTTVASEQAE